MNLGVLITAVMPLDIKTKSGSYKYAVRVKTKGVWGTMARKGSKEENSILVFAKPRDRDRYMVQLFATYGPAAHEERQRIKSRMRNKLK